MADVILDFRPGTAKVFGVQGSDLWFFANILESDGTTPIPITGYDFTMDIVTSSGAVLQALTLGDGITIISNPNGRIRIDIEGDYLIFTGSRCDITVYGLLWVTDTDDIRRPYAQFIISLSPPIPVI